MPEKRVNNSIPDNETYVIDDEEEEVLGKKNSLTGLYKMHQGQSHLIETQRNGPEKRENVSMRLNEERGNIQGCSLICKRIFKKSNSYYTS